tara:strand:+ start:36 stop:848 length:813 start_codon:yes stop_codon:yes gene_type:complete
MNKISIFTTMTNPEERMDPWKEAIQCYEDFADEVIVSGGDWPKEFKWDHIGKTFHEGFKKATGDWVIRMDIDYFLHEKSILRIKNGIKKYNDQPAISIPQYQIFTPDRYQVKTKLCIILNKKLFPNIILNGGGDLCQPTINGKQIKHTDVPFINEPIWQYDSSFRTKEIIAEDRARFARAWFRHFNDWSDRGGETPEKAFEAWFYMIENRYKRHVNKLKLNNHPKYIQDKLYGIEKDQFGFNAFGLRDSVRRDFREYVIAKKNNITDRIN